MNDFFIVLLFLSGAANRAAELVKSLITRRFPNANPDTVSLVAFLVSIAAGILGALSLNVNLLLFLPENSYLVNVPPLAGVVLTGCLAGLGSEGLHAALDLLYGKRDELIARAEMNWTAAEVAKPPLTVATKETPPDTRW